MPELIDKQASMRAICDGCFKSRAVDLELRCRGTCNVIDILQQQPAIESEPVRRGHWVLTRDEQYEYCHCSECGYDTGENWMIGSEIPYCSQCGSKNYDGGADNG